MIFPKWKEGQRTNLNYIREHTMKMKPLSTLFLLSAWATESQLKQPAKTHKQNQNKPSFRMYMYLLNDQFFPTGMNFGPTFFLSK